MENSITVPKLRIAMLGHKRVPSREGGIEIVVEELSSRMVKRGYLVTCFNRRGHHVSGAEFDSSIKGNYRGITIKSVFTINRKGLAAMTSSFTAAFRATIGRYDVVHIHAEGPAAMSWLPKLGRKKVVVTIHGLDWARAKWGGFATKYIKWGEKMAVRQADAIIVLSRRMQQYFASEYGRETIYIPNGVSKPDIKKANIIKEKYGLDKDSYVLFMGRLVPEKGLVYLVKAWKDIKTDKRLVIAGGASDSKDFTEKLKSISGENVLYTGFVQGDTLEELYSNAYIFTLPSDLEGMPLSLLEAMSYGNCCLVSDIDECESVVQDKAVVFEKSNIEDLRMNLQRLLDQPELVEKYKSESADYICDNYNWDNVVDQTLEVYHRVCSGEYDNDSKKRT